MPPGHNRGFENADFNTDIVANGTFMDVLSIMPFPLYAENRELTDNKERKKRGLPPRPQDCQRWETRPTRTQWAPASTPHPSSASSSVPTSIRSPSRQAALNASGARRAATHFDYKMDIPVRPRIFLASARYQVARDNWNGVPIEVYYDAKHPWNVPAILNTAKSGLAYFTREFRAVHVLLLPRRRAAGI